MFRLNAFAVKNLSESGKKTLLWVIKTRYNAFMPIPAALENCFKPEIRKRGGEVFTKEQAFISSGSDTRVQGLVKSTPPLKLLLTAPSIASPVIIASCSCSSGAKGILCRHVWAMLLQVNLKCPDFLENKSSIETGSLVPVTPSSYKVKQAEYKKSQYEKQKTYAKEKKAGLKRKFAAPAGRQHPVAVIEALDFFSVNGFDMNENFDEELLKKAMKQLARVFHPDKGGTHDEAVTLNNHFAVLARFFKA